MGVLLVVKPHSKSLCLPLFLGYQPDPAAEESVPQSLDPPLELLLPPVVEEDGGVVDEVALVGCFAAEGALDVCEAVEGALDDCAAAEGAVDGCVAFEGALVALEGAGDAEEAPLGAGAAGLAAFAGAGASGTAGLLLDEAGDGDTVLEEPDDCPWSADVDEPDQVDAGVGAFS
jgi:hypothetical protein